MEEEAKRILNPMTPPAQPPVTTATVQPPVGLEARPVEGTMKSRVGPPHCVQAAGGACAAIGR